MLLYCKRNNNEGFIMKKFIRYLLIISLLVVTADICSATTPRWRSMLYYEFEVISFDKATGNASIAVTITPDRDTSLYVPKTVPEMCKEIPIEITSPNNLIFKTEQNLLLDFDGKENITIIVEITFVEQSQVKLLFHATCTPTGKEINNYLHLRPDENNLSISRSSLANAKKVVPLHQKPNWDTMSTEQLSVEYEVYFQLRDEESYQLIRKYADTLISSYKKDVYKAKLTLGEMLELAKDDIEGELVHRPPWDKRTTPWKNLEEEQKKLLEHKATQTTGPTIPLTSEDSIIYSALSDMGKRGFVILKKRESEGPSIEKWGEEIWIEHECYARDSGETYFRKLPGFTKEEWIIENKRRRDSVRASKLPAVYDIIVDFRKIEDYTYFKDKVDFIEKTDREGFYQIECNKSVITEIEQRKIQFTRTNRPSWIKSDSVKAERRKQPK